jgi:hypothetical protein
MYNMIRSPKGLSSGRNNELRSRPLDLDIDIRFIRLHFNVDAGSIHFDTLASGRLFFLSTPGRKKRDHCQAQQVSRHRIDLLSGESGGVKAIRVPSKPAGRRASRTEWAESGQQLNCRLSEEHSSVMEVG